MNIAINDNQLTRPFSVSLAKLIEGLDCEIIGDIADIKISGLANDSRKVQPGDLFFAVPGFVFDGTKFIAEATSMGAVAVAAQTEVKGIDYVPVINCANIRLMMSRIAARYYDYPSKSLHIIGVTGTNGKTTVTYFINHLLKLMNKSYGSIGTVEYFTGKRTIQASNTTPDTIEIQRMLAEMRESGLDGCTMEVSSHGLDQYRCDDIDYDAAIFTNLTRDHLDYHSDFENYFGAKSILFTRLLNDDGLAVLNANDPYSAILEDMCRARAIRFSADINGSYDDEADVIVLNDGYRSGRRYFKARYRGAETEGSISHLGKFNLTNCAAALATMVGLDYDFKTVVKALETAPQIPGRVEKIDVGQPFEVIIDYAHTPDALENLLTGLDTKGRKILVFGCGGDRDKTKRPIMGEVATKHADVVFVTSDNPRTEDPHRIINDILKGIPDKSHYKVIEKRDEAIGQALNEARPGDLVIIAGKGHEDYQVIGNTRHYFSDPGVVMTQFKKMGYAGN